MSLIVRYTPANGNAVRGRLPLSGAPVQVADPPEHCVQYATEHVVRTGFVVLDVAGEFLAWAECILTAKRRCDGDPLAERVERCSDGVRMTMAPWGKFRRAKTEAA